MPSSVTQKRGQGSEYDLELTMLRDHNICAFYLSNTLHPIINESNKLKLPLGILKLLLSSLRGLDVISEMDHGIGIDYGYNGKSCRIQR